MAFTTFRPSENVYDSDMAGRAASPIDLVHLARQTMGDRELEQELLALFDHQAAQIADKLKIAEAGAASADLAHKLKGSARAIGATLIAEAAENYEHAARAGFLRPSHADRLVAAVAQAHAFLDDLA